MLVLGLDISLTHTGWVIANCDSDDRLFLKDCGVIESAPSPKKEKVSATIDGIRRCSEIHTALSAVFKEHKPLVVCMESMSWPRNAATATKMALAWGAIAPLLHDRPIIAVGPQQIKKLASGGRSASKEEVEAAVRKALKHSKKSIPLLESKLPKASSREHCWDALGSILACQQTERWRLVRAGHFQKP